MPNHRKTTLYPQCTCVIKSIKENLENKLSSLADVEMTNQRIKGVPCQKTPSTKTSHSNVLRYSTTPQQSCSIESHNTTPPTPPAPPTPYLGAWNSLPRDIRDSESLPVFQSPLKTHLFSLHSLIPPSTCVSVLYVCLFFLPPPPLSVKRLMALFHRRYHLNSPRLGPPFLAF